jgi:hypothetical protein
MDGLMPVYEAAAHQEQGMKGFVSTVADTAEN